MGAKQRLDKILAHMGYGTRSEIKKLVKSGAVAVDGQVVKDSGMQVDTVAAHIAVHGETVEYREFVYLMLNKPQGVISATEDVKDWTVIDLLSDEYKHYDVFPVGRLDKDTEGLLLLTNDGKLAHNLLSPRKHVPKTYIATVAGNVDDIDVSAFSQGVTLDDGYVTMPADLRIVRKAEQPSPKTWIQLTIQEGKFHQVKRMFEAVGKKVVYLKRISMGSLQLDEALPLGEYRELTREELAALTGEEN